MTTQQNEKFYVYRFLDKHHKVLYVGRTNDLKIRLSKHFLNKDLQAIKRNKRTETIQFVSFDKKTYTAIYEIFLINLWQPKYNSHDKYDEVIDMKFLDVDSLTWTSIDAPELEVLKEKIYASKNIYAVREFSEDENNYLNKVEENLNITLTISEKKVLVVTLRAKEVGKPFIQAPELMQKGQFGYTTLKRATSKLCELGLLDKENVRDHRRVGYNKYRLAEGGVL